MTQYRDSDAEKIRVRKWAAIRAEWMNYIPSHQSPWPLPELEVYELPPVERILDEVSQSQMRDSTYEDEVEGLRTAILHDSVISIHKAGTVLRAAAQEALAGFRTWSRSSSYHAAFFAVRGVLGLLGVAVFRGRDRQSEFQIDLWAPRESQKRFRVTECPFAVRIMRRRRVEHKELWGIFTRILRLTIVEEAIWPYRARDSLRSLEPGKFSRVRHEIHYRSAGWLYDDLLQLDTADNLDSLAAAVAKFELVDDPDGNLFPFGLALHVLSLAAALLEDLGRDVPQIADEVGRAKQWMNGSPWKRFDAFAVGPNV